MRMETEIVVWGNARVKSQKRRGNMRLPRASSRFSTTIILAAIVIDVMLREIIDKEDVRKRGVALGWTYEDVLKCEMTEYLIIVHL